MNKQTNKDMAAKIFRINYKSDFVLTLESDAGWMTPFCIKFWTGAPSLAYFVGWDGETYTHCAYDPSEPSKLTVQFDDHHLPIGDLKYQVAYHFTVADFPNDTEDEVMNQVSITTEIDGETYQVMLDFNGETAPEIQFALPAYANEAQRIANEEQRIANEQQRIRNEETRIDNEQTRINQESARVNEYAELKADAVAATGAANDAAALANQKAGLADGAATLATQKAGLADDAATLATQKAGLADDAATLATQKAGLADDAATLATQKAGLADDAATLATQKAQYAQDEGDYAKAQGDYAKSQADLIPAEVMRTASDAAFVNANRETLFYMRQADEHLAGLMTTAEHNKLAALPTAADLGTGIIYDVSALHPTSGVSGGSTYASLSAALAVIPQAKRKGGMSVKFVLSSDNKYVQYRLMSQTFSTTESDWQGVDDEPTAGSENLVKSGGVKKDLSFTMEGGVYTGGTTIGTSTIPNKSSSDTYKCLLVEGAKGDKFLVQGVGGSSNRLWYVYDKSKKLTRVADAGANTVSNPITIEFGDNEQYLVVNGLNSYIANVCYSNISDEILYNAARLSADIDKNAREISEAQSEITELSNHVDDISCYALESGVYTGGTTVGTSTIPNMTSSNLYSCVKITGKEGDKINIAGSGGSENRLWYVYDSFGILTRVADANVDTTSSPVTITFGEGEKYLCINAQNNRIKKVWGLHIPNKINELANRVDEVKDGIEELNELLMKVEDVTSDINWTANKFIKIDNGTISIVTTSANNKVGYVDITNSNIVKFRCSVLSGANYSKLIYYFTDGSRILAQSNTLPPNYNYNSGDLEMQVPDGAKYLYISWNNTITSETQYPYVITKTLKDSSNQDSIETVNLENTGVQIYEKVRYNNNDYSYTKFGYVTAASGNPDYELPNPVVLETKVDANASSRTLQIADNTAFSTPITIALDLISDKVTVYNLEPNKMYYYRVYKDGSTSSILNNGRFDTCGHVRFLKIDATEDFTQDWIKNVRDLGGWNTKNNTKTRYGCIIRGYELNHITEGVETVYISNDGKAELIRLGVSAELDLRGESSVYTESVLGNDVAYYNIGLDLWFYRLNIYNYIKGEAQKFATAIRKVLEWLEAGKGIYVHCAGGCDRTGALSAMIEGLCGVSENDINHDYELSDRDRSREYYHITGNTDPATNKYDGDFKFAMEYIKGLIEYNNHIYVYYRNNYYDAEANVVDFTPVPLADASLISNLAENNYGSLQKRFERLLVGVGGLTMNEVERLRNVLCS